MRLTELSPRMLVYYDAEQALLEIATVYLYCCTAVVLMIEDKPVREDVVWAYLAEDIEGFRTASAQLVSSYETALEASAS
jgi:hypothetical protein